MTTPGTPAPPRECSKCGACCTGFVIHLDSCDRDMRNYLELHGCYEVKVKPGVISMFIPLRCHHLTADNLCDIHKSPERPVACRLGPRKGDWVPKSCTVRYPAPPREL